MIEIIEIVKGIIDSRGRSSLINSYKLDNGIYVKVTDSEIKEDDLYVVNKKTDTSSTIDKYNWFCQRAFFEGMLNSDSNKTLLQSGEIKKKIHSVTPYAIFFKYKNIDKFSTPEIIEAHFEVVNSLNDREIQVKEISKFFFNKINEFKKAIEEKGLKPDENDRIFLFTDNLPEQYEEEFKNYMRAYGFGKSYKPIEIDGELYGLPCLGLSLDAKKLINNSSNIREIPYRISYSDNMILFYISKLRKNISEIVNKYIEDTEGIKDLYDISLNISEIVYINKSINTERKKVFHKFESISKNTSYSIDSMKSYKEILEIIENSLTNWTISPAINRYMSKGSDISDYFKKYSKNINNQYILQQIISDRDCFKHYFNGNDDIDISKSLEKVLKAIYEYKCNEQKEDEDKKNSDLSFGLFAYRLDMMLSIMNYVSGKEKYQNMAIEINEILDKFIKEKQNGEVTITNDAEFFFMSGQLIRYLAYQSEKKNKKANLMGNFMLRNKNRIKNHIIDMYDLYSYKIPLFSESYINLVYQQVISYGIGETENKSEDNWYYYQAGLAGKNIIFHNEELKNDKEQEKQEELEQLKTGTDN